MEGSIDSSPGQPQAPSQQQQALPVRQPAASAPNVTEYRLDGHTISDLSRSSRGELIPISPNTEVGGLGIGTPPSVLKRQKKRRVALSPVTENSASLSFLDSCNSLTPKSTPVKTLPFSPSQVCFPNSGPDTRACTIQLVFTEQCCVPGPVLHAQDSDVQKQIWPCPCGAYTVAGRPLIGRLKCEKRYEGGSLWCCACI